MHQLAFPAAMTMLLTLMPTGTAEARSAAGSSATPDAADEPAASAAVAGPSVRLLDPGAEPRSLLRYALTVGDTDRLVITTRAHSGISSSDDRPLWPEPVSQAMGNRLEATAEQTVVGSARDGVYDIETTYTDIEYVDVELARSDIDLELADVGRELRALNGTMTQQTVDEQGRVLSTRTSSGPDWAASGIHLGIMPGLIDVHSLQLSRLLPEEPVGVGAVWQVTSEMVEPVEGLPLTVVVTTTLERLQPDGSFELSSKGRLGAPPQRLPPGSDDPNLIIRTTGDLSARWTVDPTTFDPEGGVRVEVERTTTSSARGVEERTIAVHMETRTERVPES